MSEMSSKLEQVLEDIINCEPIFDRISRDLNEKVSFTQLDQLAERALSESLISSAEAELLSRAEVGRKWVIAVDDFNSDELSSLKLKT